MIHRKFSLLVCPNDIVRYVDTSIIHVALSIIQFLGTSLKITCVFPPGTTSVTCVWTSTRRRRPWPCTCPTRHTTTSACTATSGSTVNAGFANTSQLTALKVSLRSITVKSFLFVGHLISCILWVWQSTNLRPQWNVDLIQKLCLTWKSTNFSVHKIKWFHSIVWSLWANK